jgi:hypothetical protein
MVDQDVPFSSGALSTSKIAPAPELALIFNHDDHGRLSTLHLPVAE